MLKLYMFAGELEYMIGMLLSIDGKHGLSMMIWKTIIRPLLVFEANEILFNHENNGRLVEVIVVHQASKPSKLGLVTVTYKISASPVGLSPSLTSNGTISIPEVYLIEFVASSSWVKLFPEAHNKHTMRPHERRRPKLFRYINSSVN